jgi:hypothetical protein
VVAPMFDSPRKDTKSERSALRGPDLFGNRCVGGTGSRSATRSDNANANSNTLVAEALPLRVKEERRKWEREAVPLRE